MIKVWPPLTWMANCGQTTSALLNIQVLPHSDVSVSYLIYVVSNPSRCKTIDTELMSRDVKRKSVCKILNLMVSQCNGVLWGSQPCQYWRIYRCFGKYRCSRHHSLKWAVLPLVVLYTMWPYWPKCVFPCCSDYGQRTNCIHEYENNATHFTNRQW
jgi:Na+/melibiose symporter-like transporter